MRRGVFIVACLAAGLTIFAPGAAAGLRTAIAEPHYFAQQNNYVAFERTRAVGATVVRLNIIWRDVAPLRLPATFDSTNHTDPAYNWSAVDHQVWAAFDAGLEPIISVTYGPDWATHGGSRVPGIVSPDPVEFGRFARAIATRYNGTFSPVLDPYAEHYGEPLPRVRYWQAWNEPNRDYFFMPQYENGRMVSADHYRRMVNRFAAAVHAVHPTNRVVAGGLAPLSRAGKPGPMPFMRDLLSEPVEFDIWAHHPYTSGGPTHRAPRADDVSLGDLPEMRAVLRSAIRRGAVVRSGGVEFWVTEFSWDTRPQDPHGLPTSLHARWTSEALYRMWKNGVSLVTWFRIQDDPLATSYYQSGFYTVSGARKPSHTAFRFPVVGFVQRRGVYVWGRTPAGVNGRVSVEIKVGSRWRRLGVLSTRGGIFQRTFRTPYRRGSVRAKFNGEASLAFSLTPVRDRFVNPFGCGGNVPC